MNHKFTISLNFISTQMTQKYCSALDKSDRLYYLYTNLKILNNLLQSMCDLLRLLYASLLLNMLLMLTLGFFILL